MVIGGWLCGSWTCLNMRLGSTATCRVVCVYSPLGLGSPHQHWRSAVSVLLVAGLPVQRD